MTQVVTVAEGGRDLSFSFQDMNRYHGGRSPAGVATAFTVLQRAFSVLSPGTPPSRRSVVIRTAFRGPGARDGFEAVTRAVTDGRFAIDRTLLRSDLGRLREDFVFAVGIEASTVTVTLRDGFVTEEFIDAARTQNRTADQEARLDVLKAQLAERLLTAPVSQLYDVT
ncbi:hypothetical protein BayCH28_16890 [Mycolicibacterium sp. CH28]|uniref:hypothetical protein n=1 Tax=Mycolicibacterium sp. CH28 TaxID=2512237 RepID=UPI001080AE24|nr:hypothetical protein [Mycolicibacterium sp. CH28]TGD86475.1 hypothetical protein BayCH28_16890 [Mycolicibacterium sp. CH28]